MGWTHFDVVPTPPNTISDLTNAQLILIGDEYTADTNAYEAFVDLLSAVEFAGVQNLRFHVNFVYTTLNRIQSYSIQLMNGQFQTGSNPVTYNTPPTDATELATQIDTLIDDPYINELNIGKITYSVNRMIAYSRENGSGDFAYYQSQVVI